MARRIIITASIAALLVLAGLASFWRTLLGDQFTWDVPAQFPLPGVPVDNLMTTAKVDLGRHLFYDTRLSVNGTQSCASCHEQALAFTDGLAQAVGATGEVHPRSAMSLANVGYVSRLSWANPHLRQLEDQARIPLFGEEPVEMGMAGREDVMTDLFSTDPIYARKFQAAFPDEAEPSTIPNMLRALAAFQRVLISGNSRFDQFINGDPTAMTPSETRGMNLFFSERLECFHCHGGFNFTDSTTHDSLPLRQFGFHNTALYDEDGAGAYPESNQGLIEITGLPEDMGRFRAPTLRNVAVTAPYMHDGSLETLNDVLDHYASGGKTQSLELKSEFVQGFILTEEEREDVVNFLKALTDEEFITNPDFGNPWPEDSAAFLID